MSCINLQLILFYCTPGTSVVRVTRMQGVFPAIGNDSSHGME